MVGKQYKHHWVQVLRGRDKTDQVMHVGTGQAVKLLWVIQS